MEYGKILSLEEANEQLGNVLYTVEIKKDLFESFLSKTNNYLMVKLRDLNPIFLDDNRAAIFPIGMQIEPTEVFTVFSISVIEQLLNLSESDYISIEQRNNLLSITYDKHTLDFGIICPPNCPG